MTEKQEYLNLYATIKNLNDEFLSDSPDYPLNDIGPIRTLNIFIGANNSRKTRFLRRLTHLYEVQFFSAEISKLRQDALRSIDLLISTFKIKPKSDLSNIFFDLLMRNGGSFKEQLAEESSPQEAFLRKFVAQTISDIFFATNSSFHAKVNKSKNPRIKEELQLLRLLRNRAGGQGQCCENELEYIDKIIHSYQSAMEKDFDFKQGIKRLFFPTLRTPVAELRKNQPLLPINTKFLNLKGNHDGIKVCTGENLFNEVHEYRNSNRTNRKRFEAFQKFIGNEFFDGKEVEIVASPSEEQEKEQILIHIDEVERSLNDIGDGVQSIFLLMLPVFMADENSWVMYDEPELSLHPGFQNLLIETILNNDELKKKNLKFFVTTHSNHFIEYAQRFPEQVSLFSFKCYNKEKSIISHFRQNFIKVLNELGCRNSSVLMANCSIWVEGVSDRKYLRTFLKLYCKTKSEENRSELSITFKEDLDYTFLEYAGSNLKHYLFDESDPGNGGKLINSFSINNRIWLLADQDAGKDSKHKKLAAQAKNKPECLEYHTTGVKEIENLLPPKVLEKFLESKSIKVKTNAKVSKNDYKTIGLGEYLDSITSGETSFSAKSGTLTPYWKTELANFVEQAAINHEITWKDLLDGPSYKKVSIKNLTKSLFDFISKNNTQNTNSSA